MARQPNPKAKVAEKLYKKGYKLVDIANQIEVPASTVRRWKHQYDWDNKSFSVFITLSALMLQKLIKKYINVNMKRLQLMGVGY